MREHIDQNSGTHHVMQFDSWGEYLDWQKRLGQKVKINSGFSTIHGSPINSLSDAINLARKGLPLEGVEALNIAEEKLEQRETELVSTRFEPTYSVEGATPDIGRFLAGEHENMMSFTVADIPQVENIVTLIIAIGVRAGVSTRAYKTRGQKVMALVEAIEQTGLQTEIWLDKTAGDSGSDPEWTGRQSICYKAAGDTYDAASLMYALTDVSMHRVLGFNGMHKMPSAFKSKLNVGWSYGSSVMEHDLPHPEDYPEGSIYIQGLSSNSEAEKLDVDEILRRIGLL
jgi:hypothetical protein